MAEGDFPDPEGVVRSYLRADAGVAALVSTRVFFGVPRDADEDSFPLVTVARAGGATLPGDAPVDGVLLQVDVWGNVHGAIGDKAGCHAVAAQVRRALWALSSVPYQTGTTMVSGGDEESVIWLPDPDTNRPRYSITTLVAAQVV